MKARLLRIHAALLDRFGPQAWWSRRSPFEIAAGAILTQHTSWTNAARAIATLRAHRLLAPERIDRIHEAQLARLIRAAGTPRVKARRLKAFARWLRSRHGGRFDTLRSAPLPALRTELLAIPGIGPETADTVLLYAAHRPIFVADRYTRRVLARHGVRRADATYERARVFLEAHLPSDPTLFSEFHALLVALGKSDVTRAERRS